MITINDITKLNNNDGLTFKNGKIISYKSGWQVATEGVECTSSTEALQAVKRYGGTCGVWYSEGVYYVDKCHRVDTKREAIAIGRAHNQISIYGWKRSNLAYC